MVRVIEISKYEVRYLIYLSYAGDKELLEKYHVGKFDLYEAYKSTFDMIEITEKQIELRYFKVSFDETPIGYVITSGNHLYSFAIRMQYRTKEILTEWWDEVKNLLGEKFTCLLFENNKRAIAYLQKRGMRVEWQNTEHEKLNEVLLTY